MASYFPHDIYKARVYPYPQRLPANEKTSSGTVIMIDKTQTNLPCRTMHYGYGDRKPQYAYPGRYGVPDACVQPCCRGTDPAGMAPEKFYN